MMLKMSGIIDIIVPRGGASLIERVQRESRIPVIAHLEGLCHTYIDGAADPEKARAIVLNAKMRRLSSRCAPHNLAHRPRARSPQPANPAHPPKTRRRARRPPHATPLAPPRPPAPQTP